MYNQPKEIEATPSLGLKMTASKQSCPASRPRQFRSHGYLTVICTYTVGTASILPSNNLNDAWPRPIYPRRSLSGLGQWNPGTRWTRPDHTLTAARVHTCRSANAGSITSHRTSRAATWSSPAPTRKSVPETHTDAEVRAEKDGHEHTPRFPQLGPGPDRGSSLSRPSTKTRTAAGRSWTPSWLEAKRHARGGMKPSPTPKHRRRGAICTRC